MNLLEHAERTMSFLHRHWISALIVLFFCVTIGKLLGLYMSNIDDSDWERFKAEHDCRLLVDESGSQRLNWQCDDGKIHYRWRQQR